MKKTLLIAVVLLLTLSLPTVSVAGWPDRYFPRRVTFAGDIVVEEGYAILDVYEHGMKTIIESEPINLTYELTIIGTDGTDFTWLSQNWLDEYEPYFESWNETYDMWLNYFGRLYMRIHARDGEAMIIYRFGRITEGRYGGLFRYHLEGFGEWSDADRTIRCFEESFTIYELTYKGKRNVRAFEPLWTGLLSFTIEIEE